MLRQNVIFKNSKLTKSEKVAPTAMLRTMSSVSSDSAVIFYNKLVRLYRVFIPSLTKNLFPKFKLYTYYSVFFSTKDNGLSRLFVLQFEIQITSLDLEQEFVYDIFQQNFSFNFLFTISNPIKRYDLILIF